MSASVPIQIIVTVLPSGQVQVAGPIEDKVLCLGLLEMAKATVVAYQPPQKPSIVPFANIPDNGGLDARQSV